MDAQRMPIALHQDIEISPSLGGFDHGEGALPFRHGQIDLIIARDLKEHPSIGATLVRLPSRMQEARPEFEARRDPLDVPNALTDLLQHAFMHFVHLDERQEREIVSLVEPVEVRPEIPSQRWVDAKDRAAPPWQTPSGRNSSARS